jgi:hypothetical protein
MDPTFREKMTQFMLLLAVPTMCYRLLSMIRKAKSWFKCGRRPEWWVCTKDFTDFSVGSLHDSICLWRISSWESLLSLLFIVTLSQQILKSRGLLRISHWRSRVKVGLGHRSSIAFALVFRIIYFLNFLQLLSNYFSTTLHTNHYHSYRTTILLSFIWTLVYTCIHLHTLAHIHLYTAMRFCNASLGYRKFHRKPFLLNCFPWSSL